MNEVKIASLEETYAQMITESQKTGTVDSSKIKPGAGFEGDDKAKKMSAESGPEGKGNKVNKPVEGPSQGKDAQAIGKGKTLSKKEDGTAKKEDTKPELIPMSFDELYTKTINEEEEGEVQPAEDIEGAGFSDDTGDFESSEETEAEEEIDLAAELRLLADRLSEIADKLSIGEEGEMGAEGEMAPEAQGEEQQVGTGEGETNPIIGNESVQHQGKTIKEDKAVASGGTPQPTTLKPMKKTAFNPKMSMNPKNKIGKSGAGKAKVPAAGKDRTGTLSVAPKTTLGPKMSQNPSGTGPAVKGSGAPLVA